MNSAEFRLAHRQFWSFAREASRSPAAEFPALVCRHAQSLARATAASVFVADAPGMPPSCVATLGQPRMNGEAPPLVREAARTGEPKFFGPVHLPLFEGPRDAFACGFIPFVSACGGRTYVVALERRPSDPAFSEADQRVLLSLAFAACCHAPPDPALAILTTPQDEEATNHDPEGRQSRHRLRLLHEKIVGESSCLIGALKRLERALFTPHHVLLLGETGSGKEEMARALVQAGHSKAWKFVKVSVAGLTETLLESELFGHVKGAFTGAVRNRTGLVGGGGRIVLFFDEIGDIPLHVQVKLFELMETGQFRRVGDESVQSATVRIVAATSCDLEALMASGAFKPDFYHRFAQQVVRVPPLRHRLDDIPRFLEAFFGEESSRFTPECRGAIGAYHWPGNLREFKNVLGQLLSDKTGSIGAQDLLDEIAYRPKPPAPVGVQASPSISNLRQLSDAEKRRVIDAELARNGGDMGAIRRAAGYSDEGWAQLMIRLGYRKARAKRGSSEPA